MFVPNITTFHVPRPYLKAWQKHYPDRTIVPFDDVTWEGEFEFTPVTGGLRLIGFKGKNEHITVPATAYGKPIVEIGDAAFQNSQIRSMTLPEGIQSIGDLAFESCQRLASVTLPQSLKTIGTGAFSLCHALKEVSLPEQVKFIGEKAFWHCGGLERINLPRSLITLFPDTLMDCKRLAAIDLDQAPEVRFQIVDGVVFDKAMKRLVKYPANRPGDKYVVPQHVVAIADYAFDNARELVRVELPPKLRTLGKGAFRRCYRLERLDFPATLRSMGDQAFDSCISLCAMTFMGSPRSFSNLGNLIPESVKSLLVAPEYHDDWLRTFPDKDIQIIGGGQAANYKLRIDGPSSVQAQNTVGYQATVTVNGVALRDTEVTWKLSGKTAGCTLSPQGQLTVGDLSKNTELRLTATYKRPDDKDVSGTRTVHVLTSQSVARPLELEKGWNLVAPTFQLDQDSTDVLRAMHPFGYSKRNGGYYLVRDFRPGEAFWVYSHEEMTITQSGMVVD